MRFSVTRLGPSAAVVLLTLSLAGCTAIANRIAKNLAKRQATDLPQSLRIQGSAAAYLACLKEHSSVCETTKSLARRHSAPTAPLALKMAEFDSEHFKGKVSDVQTRISELYDRLTGVAEAGASSIKVTAAPDGAAEWEVPFSGEELEAYYNYIEEKTLGDEWRADAETARLGASRGAAVACLTKFLQEYFRAYFRDGQFVQIQFNTENLKDELKKRFPLLSDAEVAKVLKDLEGLGANLSGSLFGNVGTRGFVTRGGQTFQFPVLTVGLDPIAKQAFALPKLDAVATGSDLIRVFLEAYFDSANGLPAVNNATGCFTGGPSGCALPVFDPKPAPGPFTAEQFSDVNTIANQAEAAASSAFGRLVRGGGPIALNNEAVAQLLETLVGVTVRKAVEKGAWCWYACNKGRPETAKASRKEEIVLKVKITGAAPRVISTVR